MDPISAIFVMAVLGGLFVRGVDVATDGLLSAEVGGGVRGAGGFVVRDARERWARANETAREIRSRTRSGRAVQGMLDDAGAAARTGWRAVRVLFGEATRFGSGVRSGWRSGRDLARSARTARRGSGPWPVTEWLRSVAVRVQGPRTATPNEDPNGPEQVPNGEPEPAVVATVDDPEREADDLGPLPPKCPDCGMPIVIGTLSDHRMGRDRCHYADMDDDPNVPPEPEAPVGPFEDHGAEAYLPPTPGDPARQPIRVEIYRAYIERGQQEVRAHVRRLDAGASYHAVKDHPERSGERGWTTFHDTGWLPSMAAVVAEVRATVLDDLGRLRVPYRIEWFIDGESTAQPASQPADGDSNDPNGDPNDMSWTYCLEVYLEGQNEDDGEPSERVHRTVLADSDRADQIASAWAAEAMTTRPAGSHGFLWCHTEDGTEYVNTFGGPDPAGSSHPNGDPNVPLPSTIPDANGHVKCGCCAQLHGPLPPGEHCPNCHIHDSPNAPRDTIPNTPAPRGPSMDINSAPAAIAAWEGVGSRWESLQSRADALHAEQDALTTEIHGLYVDVATLADGMGDFAVGGEADTSASVGELADSATSAREQAGNLAGSISTAKEAVDSYVARLEDDLRPGIEAAAGKVADVHAVMQEA